VADRWFSPCPPVSSTNKTDRYNITEIFLKVALNTMKQKYNSFAAYLNLIEAQNEKNNKKTKA
jgi:hypothetical protein